MPPLPAGTSASRSCDDRPALLLRARGGALTRGGSGSPWWLLLVAPFDQRAQYEGFAPQNSLGRALLSCPVPSLCVAAATQGNTLSAAVGTAGRGPPDTTPEARCPRQALARRACSAQMRDGWGTGTIPIAKAFQWPRNQHTPGGTLAQFKLGPAPLGPAGGAAPLPGRLCWPDPKSAPFCGKMSQIN